MAWDAMVWDAMAWDAMAWDDVPGPVPPRAALGQNLNLMVGLVLGGS